MSKLVSIGFGTTGIPGVAIASSANSGYVNYVIPHGIAIVCGALFTMLYGRIILKGKISK